MRVETPETRYTKTNDGLHIAYQVLGDGPIDITLLPYLSCVDAMWEDRVFAHVLRRLAGIGRLVCFDWRGQGVSDNVQLGALPTIELLAEDVCAVLDAVGSTRTTLVSHGVAGPPVAMFFAATYPERIDSLVLGDAAARLLRGDDYPLGISSDELESLRDNAVPLWGTGAITEFMAPSRVGDESFRRWGARYERLGMSPGTWRTLADWAYRLDVRDTLANIRVPTLVLHHQDNPNAQVDHGRYLADHIAGARFVVLPGGDATFFGEGADDLLDQVEEFITGAPPVLEPDRALATVLFTDIVASTEHAARLGDKRWTQLLDQHDALIARELERHRGRRVNPTGDGILATFDGPARAVRCAQAICGAVQALGIEVRTGLHTGEVEPRGDDIGGIAVHIGQRVSALAGANETLVSRTVTDLVAGSGLQFEERGEHELKGVPGTWRLFAVKG